jgi:hypothetical protein
MATALFSAGMGAPQAAPWTVGLPSDYVVQNYLFASADNLGVMERARPDYDPKGLPLGAFRLFPDLAILGAYDSNIFRTENAQSDEFLEVLPTFRLVSQWSQDFLEFYGGANNYDYAKFSSQNLTDWDFGSDGRLDITHAAFVTANAFYSELHEPNWSPNVTGSQAQPNRYYQAHVDTTGQYQPSRLGFEWGGSFDRYDWNATPLIGGGVQSNSDRNMDEYQAYARVFYGFPPDYSGFLRAAYDSRQFDLELDRNGLNRSSTGYRMDGGIDLALTHLIHGEIFGGYLTQSFNAPLPDISTPDYGVSLTWYTTPLLTLHLYGRRDLTDTILDDASVSDDQSVGASADYELLRNIIVQAHVNYTHSHFVGIMRTDDLPDAGIGVKYLINRYLSADLSYDYSHRSSNAPDQNFGDSTVIAGVAFHP